MYKKVAILGSGSWATALAKMVMHNQAEINWFIRRQEAIDEFIATGKNPTYLGMASFDVGRINFSSDINQTVAQSDVLILAIPSPYIKKTLNKIRRDMRHKIVINAVKGMMPDDNILITDYLHQRFGIPMDDSFSIWDLEHCEPCDPEKFVSMGKATPFAGVPLYGKCLLTVCNGKIVYKA